MIHITGEKRNRLLLDFLFPHSHAKQLATGIIERMFHI